jgi:hypothetical protein
MDFQTLNAWLVLFAGAAGVVLWWLFRSLHAKVDQTDRDSNLAADWIKDDLAKFKLHCAETYVTTTVLTEALRDIRTTIGACFSKLERIEEKLYQQKADKP